MSSLAIGPSTRVTLHFALHLEGGAEIDSTFSSKAATFEVGDGSLLPGFEKVLMGLVAGDEQEFSVPPENGFGQKNPSNVQVMERSVFDPSLELQEGLMVSFSDAQNTELPGVIKSIGDDEVEVDFNHPLAGRTILFSVKIIAVEPVVTH